jgi:hypothetical protein
MPVTALQSRPFEPNVMIRLTARKRAFPWALTALMVLSPVAAAPQTDPISGLIIDEGWEVVRGTCAACHSAKLVTQNRGTRETWKSLIRWMQETQGLWPLDPGMENTILDYLARNYPPAASSRRMPLPPELLPENPYHKGSSS